MQALLAHRAAHALHGARVPLAPRVIAYVTRMVTGVEIHPAAEIGEGLFIDHGSGVVIGETAKIGKCATLYQGVTLGGTGFQRGKRHPTLGDNVTVGSGAKLLGPIAVGDGAKIGANTVVVEDVPPGATVVGNPGHRCGSKASASKAPTPTGSTCRTQSPTSHGALGADRRARSAAGRGRRGGEQRRRAGDRAPHRPLLGRRLSRQPGERSQLTAYGGDNRERFAGL